MTPWFLIPSFFKALNFNIQETYHSIRFEKDTRYYSMRIEKDLLDYWTITVTNGRIQTKLGQVRTLPFSQFSDAFDHFCGMIQVRLKRHYHLKSYRGENPLFLYLLAYAPTPVVENQIRSIARRSVIPKTISVIPLQNTTQPNPIQMGLLF